MDIDTKTIRVRAGLKPEEAFDTLMHETVHAALAVSGLTNILDDDNLEEAIVRMTDYVVFPLYKNNMTNSEKQLKKFDVGVKLINRFQILAETPEEAVAIVKAIQRN